MAAEITIRLKTDDAIYKRKFLSYEIITVSEDDPHIQEMIRKTLEDFKQRPEDCDIRITILLLT